MIEISSIAFKLSQTYVFAGLFVTYFNNMVVAFSIEIRYSKKQPML